MDDPTASGHPLDVAGVDNSFVSQTVPMFDRALQQIGDGFNSAVRMPGEAFDVLTGFGAVKIIEKEKGVEVRLLVKAKCSFEVYAGPLECGYAFHQVLYFSDCCHSQAPFYSIGLMVL